LTEQYKMCSLSDSDNDDDSWSDTGSGVSSAAGSSFGGSFGGSSWERRPAQYGQQGAKAKQAPAHHGWQQPQPQKQPQWQPAPQPAPAYAAPRTPAQPTAPDLHAYSLDTPEQPPSASRARFTVADAHAAFMAPPLMPVPPQQPVYYAQQPAYVAPAPAAAEDDDDDLSFILNQMGVR